MTDASTDRDRAALEKQIADARRKFDASLPGFLERAKMPEVPDLQVRPEAEGAEPVFIVTGASFNPIPADHPDAEWLGGIAVGTDEQTLQVGNPAGAAFVRLMNEGARIVVHSKAPELISRMIGDAGVDFGRIDIISGDPVSPEALHSMAEALERQAQAQPISEVRPILYNSFAQGEPEPFKVMVDEPVENVEKAANRRMRFVYSMSALFYDLLANRGQEQLRVVSLGALAANRASYGLLADAGDKFMTELGWRTFHHEANMLTGKPVSVIQVHPGITVAGSVYSGSRVDLVKAESVADGHPFDTEVLEGERDMPKLSPAVIGDVCAAMAMVGPGDDPNTLVKRDLADLLTAGTSLDQLSDALRRSVSVAEGRVSVGISGELPDFAYAPHSEYGKLPKPGPRDYRRVNISPPGQRF